MFNTLKQNMLSIGLGLALCGSYSANATTPKLDDFAYTATLSDAKTSLREVDLPIDVYSKMYRRDYGDLRIFSANGQVVPHQFNRAETIGETQLENLVFYPFNREQAVSDGNVSIEINQSTGKQQLKINQSLKSQQNNNTAEYQYIIENSPVQKEGKEATLCKMKLYWEQNKSSLILGLKLESSKDLQQWSTLSKKVNVSRLNYSNSQLVRDEIEFNCTSQPFLRLTWLNEDNNADAGVKLNSIQGFYTQENIQQTQWQSFAKPRYNDDGHWVFENNVIAPIVKMEFKAPQNGLLYKGKLFSRDDPNTNWRFRKQISQYRLNLGDRELQSNPFSLGGINDRYWKLEPSIETQFTEAQLPEIKAAWRSNKVLFIAQGDGPYQLAFGNPEIKPAKNSDLNNLIKTLQQTSSTVDRVSLAQIKDQGKSFSREGKTNWKKIALWFVLLLGTLLMAFMAYRLFQQMGNEAAKEKP